ncbi:MAG: hypothetical protein B6U95_00055 [Thermofilum sp. ex4484_82]|nr:MAG: hypothetical protein B6U95_00055 [Thermofilum sp. ex4484_82]OYT40122.1 MAG: hypothetical protein B6U96_00055 [Archaeoglobales archaeon ex4484_92]
MSFDELKNTHVLTPKEFTIFSDCMSFFVMEYEGYFENLSFKEQVKFMKANCPFPNCKVCSKVEEWLKRKEKLKF